MSRDIFLYYVDSRADRFKIAGVDPANKVAFSLPSLVNLARDPHFVGVEIAGRTENPRENVIGILKGIGGLLNTAGTTITPLTNLSAA